MLSEDPYITNVDLNVHLRDARHAHQFYSENNFALAPKSKFSYHVVFYPVYGTNATTYSKEIGLLVKSLDLPQFKINIENRQQYNRKKNFQTRIDYQDISMKLHDDNTGIVRQMLHEYYHYYFKDSHTSSIAFNTRDKYNLSENFPKYGMANGTNGPFFDKIVIYQLARHKWYSYTLINPIISSWTHGDLDYGEGAGINEHSITFSFESVLYDHGSISDNVEPTGFTSAETRYDVVQSPLDPENTPSAGFDLIPDINESIDESIGENLSVFDRVLNAGQSIAGSASGLLDKIIPTLDSSLLTTAAGLAAFVTPTTGSTSTTSSTTDPIQLQQQIANNQDYKDSFMSKVLNTNQAPVSAADYQSLPAPIQTNITDQIISNIGSDIKLQTIATQVIQS